MIVSPLPNINKHPPFPYSLQIFIQYSLSIHHTGNYICLYVKWNSIKTRVYTCWFNILELYQALFRFLIRVNISSVEFQPHPAYRRRYDWPRIHNKRNGRLLAHTDLIFGQQRDQSNFGLHQAKTHTWNGEFNTNELWPDINKSTSVSC